MAIVACPLCGGDIEVFGNDEQALHACNVSMIEALIDRTPGDVLPTRSPTTAQIACKAKGHGWRNGCHCDSPPDGTGPGMICRTCGMHEHFAN